MYKGVILVLVLIFACISATFAEDPLTITTYYPSPYGAYNQLQTNSLGVGDNNGNGTLDSGDVPTTNGDVWIKGKVGIGTANPTAKLDVLGSINASGPVTAASGGINRAWMTLSNCCFVLPCPSGWTQYGAGYNVGSGGWSQCACGMVHTVCYKDF